MAAMPMEEEATISYWVVNPTGKQLEGVIYYDIGLGYDLFLICS
jgi:hypothetical protein